MLLARVSGKWDAPTGNISPRDGFDRDNLGLLHQHGPSLQLIPVLPNFFWHVVDVGCDEMVWNDIFQKAKPENGDFCKELALARDAILQNDIVGRYSV